MSKYHFMKPHCPSVLLISQLIKVGCPRKNCDVISRFSDAGQNAMTNFQSFKLRAFPDVAIRVWEFVSSALRFIFLFMRFACSVSICIGSPFIRPATAFMGPTLGHLSSCEVAQYWLLGFHINLLLKIICDFLPWTTHFQGLTFFAIAAIAFLITLLRLWQQIDRHLCDTKIRSKIHHPNLKRVNPLLEFYLCVYSIALHGGERNLPSTGTQYLPITDPAHLHECYLVLHNAHWTCTM